MHYPPLPSVEDSWIIFCGKQMIQYPMSYILTNIHSLDCQMKYEISAKEAESKLP